MKHGAYWMVPSMALAALLTSACAGGSSKPVDSPAAVKAPGTQPAARDPNSGCQVDNCDPKNAAEN